MKEINPNNEGPKDKSKKIRKGEHSDIGAWFSATRGDGMPKDMVPEVERFDEYDQFNIALAMEAYLEKRKAEPLVENALPYEEAAEELRVKNELTEWRRIIEALPDANDPNLPEDR